MNKKIFTVTPFVIISLILGLLSGLLRMGWIIPVDKIMGQHGAIMVGSFLGTLILLERIVTMKKTWLYLFPIASGLSILFFVVQMQTVALILISTGALGLIYVYIVLIRKFGETYHLYMMFGAIGLLTGNLILIVRNFYPAAVPWWFAFLLLTIVGERLELSKFLPTSPFKRYSLTFGIVLFLAGLFFPFHNYGTYISGAGILTITFWLLKYDIARKSARATGIHRFTGTLLLLGYFWLGVTGTLMFFPAAPGFYYDAMLHSFFMGFTFSMIFAHAPIILPGVAGLPIRPFHQSFYFWAILLQLSVAGRLVGDLIPFNELRRFSGLAGSIVIPLYIITLVFITRHQYSKTRTKKANP